MIDQNKIKQPTKKEIIVLRSLIVIGLFSTVNFYFWFFRPNLIQNPILFWCLVLVMFFDTLRVIYIWYHYWSIKIPSPPKNSKAFTVDALTTYFPGEPYAMTTRTLLALKNISYPHTTYLCDEADDPYLKNFCLEHDIVHVTRKDRVNAKAGNINNALKQATGDICLILDPDHVPKPTLLDEVLPYFADESIGFVQSVQGYYNIEESSVARGAAEQTFHFYGPIMMCMNSYGTVNAIGANCVFRRAALDSIGGHAPGLAEDMHTSMKLHAKGWKSVYVPKVLTKGLAPATLTSYYMQQLKWTRGTLDLLVTVFPKLFSQFSWRQKLHYGLLPMHYLSGIFFLIGFLVPIISLIDASIPWKGNILNFGLIFLPVLASIVCIRLYVQKWVFHKSERGIHLTGGLLLICSWWIFLLGFIYTIINKKVPYLPTPKEDRQLTNIKILIPNMIVAVISLIAIVYGLYIDLTPFSVLMAGFVLLNVFFMIYTFHFAYQKSKPIDAKFNDDIVYNKKFQNFYFKSFNKFALLIATFCVFIPMAIFYYGEHLKWGGATPDIQNKKNINYVGIFAPSLDNGLTDLKNVTIMEEAHNTNFDLISLYVAWEKNSNKTFPKGLIDSIYQRKSVPVLTWEPWIHTFKEDLPPNIDNVYEAINIGLFDDYIKDFAVQMKQLNRPIFLRIFHEFDNAFYPWHIEEENEAPKFKMAWIHVYEIFKKSGADNVIWVWNPSLPANVEIFYPGEDYVDWIGFNILNYDYHNISKKSHSFKDLYHPFHEALAILPDTPIMILELGALQEKNRLTQNNWVDDAIKSIEENYKEINAVIYFHSKLDDNFILGQQSDDYLDWTLVSEGSTLDLFENKKTPKYIFNTLVNNGEESKENVKIKKFPTNILGVNLKKGHSWSQDYHILNKKNLNYDFEMMRKIGINTIKYQSNSVYDYNVEKISEAYGMQISSSFWISEEINFIEDSLRLNEISQKILATIHRKKDNSNIISWHIDNDILYNQKNYFHKPEILFQNNAYLKWLNNLTLKIKTIDSSRPLVVEIEINKETINNIIKIRRKIKNIDTFGLVIKDMTEFDIVKEYLEDNNIAYIISSIEIDFSNDFRKLKSESSMYASRWQDMHEFNQLSFDGLVDRNGRLKESYFMMNLDGDAISDEFNIREINILKPSTLVYGQSTLSYLALVSKDNKNWEYGYNFEHLKFEWALIKCDEHGNPIALKEVGNTPILNLKIPDDHQLYRLHLSVIEGNTVRQHMSRLNTQIK